MKNQTKYETFARSFGWIESEGQVMKPIINAREDEPEIDFAHDWKDAAETTIDRMESKEVREYLKKLIGSHLNKIERDYEPEQSYGTAHDFQEHTRFGGTRDDY